MNVLPTLPCCFFPTRVAMVDDQESVIDSLRFHLEAKAKKFTDSSLALKKLLEYTPSVYEELWLKPESNSDVVDGVNQQLALIDIKAIKSIANNPLRHQDISVIIVDYQMPGINGLELLEKLVDKPFKKILLTGQGDDRLAVDAFNKGLIDYFLRKDDIDLPRRLNQTVKDLQKKYFVDLCAKTLLILSAVSPFFRDQNFIRFFEQEIISRKVKEYYLLDANGAYMLEHENQDRSYFVMQTAAGLEALAEAASTDGASEGIIKQISTGQAIPFFGENKNYWEVKAAAWGKYLYTASLFGAESTYFYAFTKN